MYNFSKLEGLIKKQRLNLKLCVQITSDLDVKLHENKDEILNLLGLRSVKRYYYQKGH